VAQQEMQVVMAHQEPKVNQDQQDQQGFQENEVFKVSLVHLEHRE